MHPTPLNRAIAAFLCCQPVFWTSNVALAQSLDDRRRWAQPDSFARSDPGAEAKDSFAGDLGAASVRDRSALPLSSRPAATPVDEPVDPGKYVCGVGDVLELNFWGIQNFKLRVTVDLEGRAFISKIGYVDLQGKTLADVRSTLRHLVARYYPRLSFDVGLAEPRTFLVQVVDDVARPASYPARAVDRVATLIERAGGFGPNASKRRIEIRRRDGTVVRADLLLYTLTGDVKHNPYLLDGDVVRVPFEDLAASIEGAVNRPGRYELVGTRDLAELVELAGGLAATSTRLLPVSIVRRLPDDRQGQTLLEFAEGGQFPSASLEHEDRIRFPTVAELERAVTVIGAVAGAMPTAGAARESTAAAAPPDEVAAMRRLPFVKGDSVRTLLERVGGVAPAADLAGAYVLRNGQSLPLDLYALVVLRDLRADRPVEIGDTLVIPFMRRNVVVEGAVSRPGEYTYNPTFRIEQYLALAGGRNRLAKSLSDVRVVSPDGGTKGYERDLQIAPGSAVVVPERNFSRAEVVQIVLGAASILVSGVAVVMAARN